MVRSAVLGCLACFGSSKGSPTHWLQLHWALFWSQTSISRPSSSGIIMSQITFLGRGALQPSLPHTTIIRRLQRILFQARPLPGSNHFCLTRESHSLSRPKTLHFAMALNQPASFVRDLQEAVSGHPVPTFLPTWTTCSLLKLEWDIFFSIHPTTLINLECCSPTTQNVVASETRLTSQASAPGMMGRCW